MTVVDKFQSAQKGMRSNKLNNDWRCYKDYKKKNNNSILQINWLDGLN